MNTKQQIVRIGLSTFNAAVSVGQFIMLINLVPQAVKLYRKMTSFLSLASTVPMGIIELSFFIFIYAFYFRFRNPRILLQRFLTVTGIQALIFSVIAFIRLIVYAPFARSAGTSMFALLRPVDAVQLWAGLGAGLVLLLVPWRKVLEMIQGAMEKKPGTP